MASYNKVKLIVETIDSVINQAYPDWELIIVDDNSTDGSQQLIKDEYKDSRVILLEQPENRGANYCRNAGLNHARGKYVMFLDADDILANDCLEKRVKATERYPQSNLLIFSMGVFLKKVGDDARTWIPATRNPLKDFLQHKLPWSILQPLWKAEFLKELGGFDTEFKRLQDVELNTRALLHKDVQLQVIGGEPDCYYRIDDERRNYDVYNFDLRRVEASLQYFSKYYAIALNKGLASALYGTIYHAYLLIMFDMRYSRITKSEFAQLEKKLFAPDILKRPLKKLFFKMSKVYNLYLPRIPGCNFLLNKLITG